MEIHQTTDYSKFDTINGNRNIGKKKIEAIVDDINGGLNLLPFVPIIVYPEKDKYMIVDGQHRYNVSVMLELPVYYVISEPLTLRQMAMINNRQDKWKMHDFLNCYINIGIEDYKKVQEIMRKYKVGISTSVDLLMLGKISKHAGTTKSFKDGEFKCNFYDETVKLLELSHSLFKRYVFYTDRNLLSAVLEIKKKGLCDFEVLQEKINKAPMLMDKQVSDKDYIFNIERVYNHGNQKRQVIF